MPTYDYACTHCDHAFEVFQAFTDDALTECPECGGRLRKVFGSVGVVFKGSGFYRTDSRSSSTVPAAKSSDGGSGSAGGSGSSSSSGSSGSSGSDGGSKGSSDSSSGSSSSSESSSSSSSSTGSSGSTSAA
jgi:putative FmdB family regulatory protein